MSRRVAVVTGGTRGIGRAISLHLARAGYTPAMVYHQDQAAAEACLEEVRPDAPDASVHAGDISDPPRVDDTVREILAAHGRIDALVNNAFRPTGTPNKVHELPIATWLTGVQANLTGPFLFTRACLPPMIDGGFGRIVFIGSLAMRGEPGRAIYSAVKNGQLGLMRTIAREYAKLGITSNMVSPGFTDAGAFLRLDETIRSRAEKSVPMRRLGRADEVAAAVRYLLSDEAGYTTGQNIGVDGGAAL